MRHVRRPLAALRLAALLASCAAAPPSAAAQAPLTNVGTRSAIQTATVTITTAGMLHSISALTQGATGLDFQEVLPDAGTCTTGTDFGVGDTCTVQYTFTPTHPWIRYGGIALFDASGKLLGNFFLTGTGSGPQVSYPITLATAPTALGSGFGNLDAVAVDGSGNVYVADTGNGLVKEIVAVGGVIPASPTIRTLGSGFSSPAGIAVDGSGNVYVGDTGNNAVKEIVAVAGVIPATNPTINMLGSGFSLPSGVAVDGSGNVFVADFGNNAVKEVLAVNGVIPSSPPIRTLGSGFSDTEAVAVDGSGNVFVADQGHNAIKEIVAVGGVIPATNPTINTLGSGFSFPSGVAVDGAGNVYVGDSHNAAVKEIEAVSGTIPATNPTIDALGNGFTDPIGVAVDANGNVFVADFAMTAVSELNAQIAPTISFASTVVGSTSSDSPETAVLENNGNAPLVFAIPGAGSNPATTADFSLSASSTCPILNSSSVATASLDAGLTCTEILSFTPVSAGSPITGTSTATDNNLNAAAATQQFPLTGTGVAGILGVSVNSPSVSVNTSSVTLQASISFPGVAPTGAVTFAVNGGRISAACASSSSSLTCTASYNPSNLTAADYTIAASIASDSNYISASGSGTLTITQATPTVNLTPTTGSSTVGQSVTFTASVTPASGITPTGEVSFSKTLNGVTSAIPGCTSVSLVSVAGTLRASCTAATLQTGSNSISASIASDSNFNAATSNSATQTVSQATPAVTLTGPSSSTVNNTVTFTATVTPNSGIIPTGKVSFSSTLNGTPTAIAGCTAVSLVSGAGPTLTATCTTSALAAGSNSVSASIASDTNFNAATSNTATQTVNQATPTLSLTPTTGTSTVNGSVTFTSAVSPNSGITPTGKVSFSTTLNGTTTAIAGCTAVSLISGAGPTLTATCTTSALPVGLNAISASIASDTNFNAATSNTATQTVNRATPTLSLTPTTGTSPVNGSVTFTSAVSPNSGITPTGKVSFSTTLNGTTTAIAGCTAVSLISGAGPTLTATCTTSALAAGSNSVSASIASDANFNAATSNTATLTVSAGPLAKFSVPGAPVASGAGHSLTITAQDAGGNTATTFNGTANLTSSDPAFTAGPGGSDTVTFVNGVGSIQYVLETAGTQTIEATDPANSAVAGTGAFNVVPGAVNSYTFSAPATATAGAAFGFTVTAHDAFGNVATNYLGAVHFTSSDPQAVLPADATLTIGVGTFSATLKTPGTQTITATDTANSSATSTSSGITVSTPGLIVTTLNDGAASPSACTVQAAGSTGTDAACSLRDAVAFANNAGAGNIGFAPALTVNATTASPATIALANGQIEITQGSPIALSGPGANLLRVSSNNTSRIFQVDSGVTATISGLTLTGGAAVTGGAILNAGALSLTGDTVTGSTVSGNGGAIEQTGGSLTVLGSTISGNAAAQGGGIFAAAGSVTLQASTISANTSSSAGGGLSMQGSGTLTITRATITGNAVTASGSGGGVVTGSATSIVNSIIAGNSASSAADISGPYTDGGGNVVGVTSSGGTAVYPLLSPLGYYGGPTQTMVPLPSSPASCAAMLGSGNGSNEDQRDDPRVATYGTTTCVDSGSVQSHYAIAFTTQPSSTIAGAGITPAPVVQITESGVVQAALTGLIVMSAQAGMLTGTTSVASSGADDSAMFSGLSFTTPETNDTLTATLALTTSLNVTATSTSFTVAADTPTITFTVPNHTYGDAPFTVSASSNSTGAFAYSVVSGPATVSGSTVTLTGIGTVMLQASEAADANDNATSKSASFTVSAATLTVTANNASRVYGAVNPTFSGSITGNKYNDSFTESFSTSAALTSAPANYSIVPSASGSDLSDYTITTVDGTLTITQAPTVTTLTATGATINPNQTVTLTAQVASTTSGTPTDSVTFFDNGTALQTVSLTGGSASYATALLAGIAHTITATYSGDTDFLTSASTGSTVVVTAAPLDFSFTFTGQNLTVAPGKAAVYTFSISPDYGTYAGPVTFSAVGLPPGATASFSPSSLAANGGPQTVTLTVQTAESIVRNDRSKGLRRSPVPASLAILLLPLVGFRRGRRLAGSRLLSLLLLLGGLAAMTTLSGCGAGTGFGLQEPQTYTVTVTATGGSIAHTASVTLTVQ